jgi:hypothetical protein
MKNIVAIALFALGVLAAAPAAYANGHGGHHGGYHGGGHIGGHGGHGVIVVPGHGGWHGGCCYRGPVYVDPYYYNPPPVYVPGPVYEPSYDERAPFTTSVPGGRHWNGYEWVTTYITVTAYWDSYEGRYFYRLNGRKYWL